MKALIRFFAMALVGCITPLSAQAQSDWPKRPIHVMSPSPAGTSSDLLARTVMEPVVNALGTQLIVEYKPGAAGTLSLEAVTKAPADGYTLSSSSLGAIGIATTLYAGKLRYDPLKDLVGVARLVSTSNILVTTNTVPARTLNELVAYSKTNPGKMNVGHLAGYGTSFHMSWVLLAKLTGLNAVDIPLKGPSEAIQGLLSGEIQLAMGNTNTFLPYIRDRRMRAIAVSTATRDKSLPEVPTLIESGIAGYDVSSWFGLVARSGTPQAIIDRLSAEILKSLADPNVQKALANQGLEPYPQGAREFDRFTRDEIARWAPVVRDSGFKPE